MFTEKNTLKEIMEHPLLAPIAPYFVENVDWSKEQMYEMTIEEIHKNRISNGYALLVGFNRLLKGMEENNCFYPLYSEEECAADPRKKDVFFLYFPSMYPDANERPLVISVPGGGNTTVWNMTEGFPIADGYNKLGFNVAVLTYRVGYEKLYPDPLDDMAAMLRYIEAHQEEFHMDAKRYITVGFSAGGYVVNAWGSDIHGYSAYGLSKPEMNVPVYGFVSWNLCKEDPKNKFATISHGCSPAEAAADGWSVEDHVKGFPPSYIIHGAADPFCSAENSRVLAKALEAEGIPCALEIKEGEGHGFGIAFHSSHRGWIERSINYYYELYK